MISIVIKLCADDTLTKLYYCTGKNVNELTNNVHKCVVAIREWHDMNRLVINSTKSTVMFVTTRSRFYESSQAMPTYRSYFD